MVRFESLTRRFESLNKLFNSGAFQANSKKAIRIPHTTIRIHILESANWRRWFESFTQRFESTFQRVQTDKGDSNPSWRDSNPNSSKVIEIDRIPNQAIRIPNQAIRIPYEERKDAESHRLESLFSDLNPYEEHE